MPARKKATPKKADPKRTTPPAIDGRRARGQRTRLKVTEALLDLVEAGQLRPTAQEIAYHAGVALRTVYHHFEDVGALRAHALTVQIAKHRGILHPIDNALDLNERILIAARQARRLSESVSAIRRATLFDEMISEELARELQDLRTERRRYLSLTFSSELERRSDDRRVLLDAVDIATCWQTWHHLRFVLGRSANAAERVVQEMLTGLFTRRGVTKRVR